MIYRTLIFFVAFALSVSLFAQPAAPQGEPTTAKEAAAQNVLPPDVTAEQFEQYTAWVASLKPEERAWQKTLATYMGNYYYPRYIKDKLAGKKTIWDYVEDDPALPRVLLIGDSISGAYTAPLRERLKGKANIHKAPANCGPTTTGLRDMDGWLGDGKWDVITFNFGIHDRRRKPEEYAANLEKIIDRLEKTGAKLLWIRTTPFNDRDEPVDAPAQGGPLNDIADPIMKRRGIPICDVYTPIVDHRAEFLVDDRVHFREEGKKVLGKHVAEAISPLLP